jgi:Domain of Unknown Function (DUF1543)
MHLYVAYLGGPMPEGQMGEGHEVVTVVAGDPVDARARAKAKWSGYGRSHVDALQRIESVDGFRIDLVPTASGDRAQPNELFGYNE